MAEAGRHGGLAHVRRCADAQQDCPAVDRRGRRGRSGLARAAFKDAHADEEVPEKPDDSAKSLRHHLLLLGERVFVNDQREIAAVRLSDGRPIWSEKNSTIFRDQMEGVIGASTAPADTLGVPRFTMTAVDGRLYARMGNPVTGRPQDATWAVGSSYVVCLDLEAEGKLLWKAVADEGWAFEGSPVADAAGVYVAMRRNDIRPRRCRVPRSAQRADAMAAVRLRRGNPGPRHLPSKHPQPADAARRDALLQHEPRRGGRPVDRRRARLLWVSLYPRARHGDLLRMAPHWQRDLTPCLLLQRHAACGPGR